MSPLHVILFTTSTCVHCKPVKAALEEIATKHGPDMNLVVHTVDKQPAAMETAKQWGVGGVPTMIFIQDQAEVATLVGGIDKEKLGDLIAGYLQSDVLQEQSGGSESSSDSVLCGTGEQKDG